MTAYMQANTTFCFQIDGTTKRTAHFADCDDIMKLFNHARTGRLFKTWAHVGPLSCQLDGGEEEICVMKDIAGDFEEVVRAIKTSDCWKSNPLGRCVVIVTMAD